MPLYIHCLLIGSSRRRRSAHADRASISLKTAGGAAIRFDRCGIDHYRRRQGGDMAGLGLPRAEPSVSPLI